MPLCLAAYFLTRFLTGMGTESLLFADPFWLGEFFVWAIHAEAAMAKPVKTATPNM